MAKTLIKNYTYNQAAGTITFTDFTTIQLKNILLITDVTAGKYLYQFNTNGPGASVATNVLTLAAPVTGTANGDTLQIYYDADINDPTFDTTSIKGGYRELSSLTAAALNADLLPSTDVSAYKTATLQLVGSAANLTISFQVSNDNTNWILWDAMTNQVGANPKWASINVNPATGSFIIPLGFRYLRVRVTSYTSGSVAGTLELHTLPISLPSIQASQNGSWSVGSNSATGAAVPANAHFLGVNNTAGNLAGLLGASDNSDGYSTTGNGNILRAAAENFLFNGSTFDRQRSSGPIGTAAVAGSFTEVTGSAAALNADVIPSTDVSAFKSLSLQLNGTWSGNLSFQGSNDGVNWVSTALQPPDNASTGGGIGSVYTARTANGIFIGPVTTRYIRVRMTSYTSGTATSALELYTVPFSPVLLNTVANPNGNFNSESVGATGSASPAKATFVGMVTSGGNLQGHNAMNNVGDSASGSTALATGNTLYNGTNYDRQRSSGPAGTAAVAGTFIEQAGLSAASLNADLVPSTDVGAYKYISLQIITLATGGNISFQASNDGTNWVNFSLTAPAVGNNPVSVTSAAGIYQGILPGRYFRARQTSFTSGSSTGVLELYTQSPATGGGTYITNVSIPSQQSGTWNVGASSTVNAATPTTAHFMGMANGANLVALQAAGSVGDGQNGSLYLATLGSAWNGSTYDRLRNNSTLAAIAAGTTTGQTSNITTYNARSIVLLINVSAFTSGSLDIAISGVSASGYVYPLLSTITSLTAVGLNAYRVGLGFTPAVGLTANDALPRVVRVAVSGTFVATYGVDYMLGV